MLLGSSIAAAGRSIVSGELILIGGRVQLLLAAGVSVYAGYCEIYCCWGGSIFAEGSIVDGDLM